MTPLEDMHANNIDEVIAYLDVIVDQTKADSDPLGYFAAMYRAVTIRIKSDIDDGLFDDGPRMDRVDTTFANYYLRAFDAHQNSLPISPPWQVAFAFAQRSTAGVFQHLLLGMNAHINFDLAQAMVDEEGGDLDGLKGDYDRINQILIELLGPLQDAVGEHLRGAPLVDRLLGRLDEDFGGWQISKARGHAWHHALELALALPSERVAIVRHMDRYVVRLANHLLVAKHPPACIPWWIARRLERTHVREIIESIEGAS